MKTNLIILAFTLGFLTLSSSCTTQGSYYSQGGDQGYVDIQVFYDQLRPYGQWTDYPDYGYVWIPGVGRGFSPYQTNGQWVMTEYGWTWISDYSWGWAPFHYGRWDFDNRFGWFWIPDTEWGPAWVTWRRAEGYYGWAPMGPRVRAGYYRDYGDVNRWHFVRDRDFGRSHINRYEINRSDYDRLLRNSSVINNTHVDRRRNTTYVAGPSAEEVQRVTGRRISSLAVRDNNRPGTVVNKDQVRIYRPQVQGSTRSTAPSRDQASPDIRSNSKDNIYLPNNRRNEKMNQMQRQGTVQPNQNRTEQTPNTNTNRRQQRLEQRRADLPDNGQNSKGARPLGQRKREETRQQRPQQIEQRSQQIEQPQSQPQSQPDQSSPQTQPDNQSSGRRR